MAKKMKKAVQLLDADNDYENETKNKYMERLLTHKLVSLLGGNDSISFDAVIMTVNIQMFSELMQSLRNDELFEHINDKLAGLLPPVNEFGGIVYQYLGSGFHAFFNENAEAAVRAGLKVCGGLWEYETGAVSLCFGNIMVGLIGGMKGDVYGEVMPAAISETTGLSEYIMKIAPKYSAKIIAAGSFADRIEDFRGRFLTRFIGYVYVRSSRTYERLYDVFQADEQEVLWMKRKTKLMFEEGVRLFCSFQYKMARRHFIEVLKVYRGDNASKCYLKLCDDFMKADIRKDNQICIEEY